MATMARATSPTPKLSNKFGLALKAEVEERRQKYNTDMSTRRMPRPLVFLSEGERMAYMRNRCEQADVSKTVAFYKIENDAFLRDFKRAHNVFKLKKRRFEKYASRARTSSEQVEGPPTLVVEPIQDGEKIYYAVYTVPSKQVPKNYEPDGKMLKSVKEMCTALKDVAIETEKSESCDENDNEENVTPKNYFNTGDQKQSSGAISITSACDVTTIKPALTDSRVPSSPKSVSVASSKDEGKKCSIDQLSVHGHHISPQNRHQRPKSTIGFRKTPEPQTRPKTAIESVSCKNVMLKLKEDSSNDDHDDILALPNRNDRRGQSAAIHRPRANADGIQNGRQVRCKTAPPGGRQVDFDRSILSKERRPPVFDRVKAAYLLRQELKKPRKHVEVKKQEVDIEHERRVEKARWNYYDQRVAEFSKTLVEMKRQHTIDVNKWVAEEMEEKLQL